MKIYLRHDGDRATGMDGEQITVDLHSFPIGRDLREYFYSPPDPHNLPDFLTDLLAFFNRWFGQEIPFTQITLDDECPKCSQPMCGFYGINLITKEEGSHYKCENPDCVASETCCANCGLQLDSLGNCIRCR